MAYDVSGGDIISTSQRLDSLEVILKISERCNLACDYCYFFFSGDETYKSHPPLASSDVAAATGAFLSDAGDTYDIKVINLIFHGGEPLMMPKAKFIAFCETLLGAYTSNTRLQFSMQTNGALITPDWIDTFERFSIGVGVSFDGPPEINDRHRVDLKGKPSYARCRKGWDLLRDAAEAGRVPRPGLLSVINPDADADEIFDHFVDDMGAKFLNFLLPDYSHDTLPQGPYVENLGRTLSAVFANWARRRDPDLSIRFIQETAFPLFKPDQLGAMPAMLEDLRNQISIGSNGEVYPEDTVKILPGFRDSDITVFNATIRDLFGSEIWRRLGDAATVTPAPCRSCEWLKICRSGRLHNRFSQGRMFDNASVYCHGLKDYYQNIAAAAVRSGGDLDAMVDALMSNRPELEA